MILYHATINPDLKIHNKGRMFFTFSQSEAYDFGWSFFDQEDNGKCFYVYKILATVPLELIYDEHKEQKGFDTDCSDYDHNWSMMNDKFRKAPFLGALPLYEDAANNLKPYVGHLEIEEGTTNLCLYVPETYCLILSKKEYIIAA